MNFKHNQNKDTFLKYIILFFKFASQNNYVNNVNKQVEKIKSECIMYSLMSIFKFPSECLMSTYNCVITIITNSHWKILYR